MNSGEEVELLHLGDVTPAWESQTQPWMMLQRGVTESPHEMSNTHP